jgi:hypothetical protein
MPTDFRIITPRVRFSKFYNSKYFVVPCEIIELLGERRHNGEYVKLKILDPITGELIFVRGLIWDSTIEIFNELNAFNLPLLTQTCVYKNCNIYNPLGIDYVVYGMFNADLVEGIFGIDEEGFLTERQLNEVFNENYEDLREWLNPPLPF